MNKDKIIETVKAHLQAAEMRQGTTDYEPYAIALLNDLTKLGALIESNNTNADSPAGLYFAEPLLS